jgi:hypothetical protein
MSDQKLTNRVSDGLGKVQATGQKVRDGVGALATGVRDEAGTAAHGIQEGIGEIWHHREHSTTQKRKQSAWTTRAVQLAASAAGALAAFVVSRLVRGMLGRHGE